MMGHHAQVVLALGISVTLSLIAWGWARSRLYATGRGFVPPVGHNLYGKLAEQLKLAGQPVPDETDQPNANRPAPGLQAAGRDCR
jgi:hypothetical protein